VNAKSFSGLLILVALVVAWHFSFPRTLPPAENLCRRLAVLIESFLAYLALHSAINYTCREF